MIVNRAYGCCSLCGKHISTYCLMPEKDAIGFIYCKNCLRQSLVHIEILEIKEKDDDVSRC